MGHGSALHQLVTGLLDGGARGGGVEGALGGDGGGGDATGVRSTSTAETPAISPSSSRTEATQWPQVMPVIFRSVVVISCS
ncbi:hypothetical protein GY12_14445 [Micrococcus luteus]|nr:hypothetical protein GY12_14445 [Micrococcus luteus]